MRAPGSTRPRSLPPAPAFAAALAGVAAMIFGGAALAFPLGLGVRATLALGSTLLAAPTVILLLALRRASWRDTLALGAASRRPILLSGALGAALWLGSLGLMEVQSLVIPPPPEYLEAFRALHRALTASGPLDALVSLTVIALLPAVAEELVMRGVLLPSLVAPLGRAGAVLASALFFAAMHADSYRFLFTLTIGLVLGVVRLRTGSLWPPIVAHATLNALTFVVAPLVDDPTRTTYTPEPVLGLACLAAGSALALPLLRSLSASVDSPRGAP